MRRTKFLVHKGHNSAYLSKHIFWAHGEDLNMTGLGMTSVSLVKPFDELTVVSLPTCVMSIFTTLGHVLIREWA